MAAFHLAKSGRRFALAAAASLGVAWASGAMAEPIDVTIDFAKLVKLNEQPHTVIVGNPGIADATAGGENMLVVTGKAAGTTNLIVLDDKGEEILDTTLRVSSDVRQLTTVFYGGQRQTFSCAPVCEQVISVGDNRDAFEAANSQIQARQQFSGGQ
jgi:Flp pilus assembly secretin CpaC